MTLKEAAERLGMTKPGIRHRMKVIGIPLEKDAFGRVELSEEVLQWIRDGKKPESTVESGEKREKKPESAVESESKSEKIPENNPVNSGKNEEIPESEDFSAFVTLVNTLREEIKEKDAQIAGMQKTIDSLSANLSNVTEALTAAQRTAEGAQALQAATVKMLQEATATNDEPDTSGDDARHKKRSLLDRILGRV